MSLEPDDVCVAPNIELILLLHHLIRKRAPYITWHVSAHFFKFLVPEYSDLHREDELAAQPSQWLCRNTTGQPFTDLLANRQSNTIACWIPLLNHWIVWPVEGLEDILEILSVHSNAFVFYWDNKIELIVKERPWFIALTLQEFSYFQFDIDINYPCRLECARVW